MPEITLSSLDTPITRRTFLAATGLAVNRPAFAQPRQSKLPVTGSANRNLEPFDQLMASFVTNNGVPGASLAVTRYGRLVYARGFGYADVEKSEPVEPTSLFRIASVSKPLTAVAVLQLAAKGKLKLDDPVMERMKVEPFRAAEAKLDDRWKRITVRHCLQHTGGWDRDKSYDPIGRAWDIAKALDIRPPVRPVHIVRYMMGQPLDFDPGARYAYSNLGYLVLGRIIEEATGQSYEEHIKKAVLSPLGVKTAQLGRARVENRAKGEVRYYDAKKRTGPALYPPRVGEQVPLPYGAENFEAFEAHGGWIASAVDLVKFAAAFDIPARCPLLTPKAMVEMWARPNGAAGLKENGKPKAAYYGCGWNVRAIGQTGRANTWHTGFIAGTEALLVRRWDSLNWAVLFNTANNPDGKSLAGLIDGLVHEAADKVKVWPNLNQFSKYLK